MKALIVCRVVAEKAPRRRECGLLDRAVRGTLHLIAAVDDMNSALPI